MQRWPEAQHRGSLRRGMTPPRNSSRCRSLPSEVEGRHERQIDDLGPFPRHVDSNGTAVGTDHQVFGMGHRDLAAIGKVEPERPERASPVRAAKFVNVHGSIVPQSLPLVNKLRLSHNAWPKCCTCLILVSPVCAARGHASISAGPCRWARLRRRLLRSKPAPQFVREGYPEKLTLLGGQELTRRNCLAVIAHGQAPMDGDDGGVI